MRIMIKMHRYSISPKSVPILHGNKENKFWNKPSLCISCNEVTFLTIHNIYLFQFLQGCVCVFIKQELLTT